MAILDFIFRKKPKTKKDTGVARTAETTNMPGIPSGYTQIFTQSYNGENNYGALGDTNRLYVDTQTLSVRSWEMFLKSDIAYTLISRKVKWVIGKGLHLKVEPDKNLFEHLGIKIEAEKHNALIESLWRNMTSTIQCDYNKRWNFAKLQSEAYKNREVGGCVLAICRITDDFPTIQLIDGSHVSTPIMFPIQQTDESKIDNVIGFERVNPENGNPIRDGIEVDKDTFSVVAFHVRTWVTSMTYIRVEKFNRVTGEVQADLFNGLQYRLDNYKGIPSITPSMENLNQISEYKAATLQGAVSRASVAYTIEHELGSSGENPLAERMVSSIPSFGVGIMSGDGAGASPQTDLGPVAEGKLIANNFTAQTKNTMLNMPVGSTVKFHEAKQEAKFREFLDPNLQSASAQLSMPVEVAFMKYEGSFSSSRAGLKDWEHTLRVERAEAAAFNQLYFNFWLDWMVLSNRLDLPEYRKALMDKNQVVLNAYRNVRWEGANVPHIDPEKEARTERLKLGALGANLPLTDQESATMALNGGDSTSNTRQFSRELDEAAKLKIPTPQPIEQSRITE